MLFLARKYLIPQRKQLSVSFVALLSLVVISLVVWLVLTFLSVLGGIESRWLEKLTQLHSPIRIIPTEAYYSSYYYNIDTICLASNYELKTLREKWVADTDDPYDPDFDEQIPDHLPPKEGKDLVKELGQILQKDNHLHFDFFEVAGALLKLQIKRSYQKDSFLSQMAYIAPYSEDNPNMTALLKRPTNDDINNLLYQNLGHVEAALKLTRVCTATPAFSLPPELFSMGATLSVQMHEQDNGDIHAMSLGGSEKIYKTANGWLCHGKQIPFTVPLMAEKGTSFNVAFLDGINATCDIQGKIQGEEVRGKLSWKGLEVIEGVMPPLPLGNQGIYLPKGFKDAGVKMGDRGHIAYMSTLSTEEQLFPIEVTGFYDPGVIAIGAKCLFMHPDSVHDIAKTSRYQALDPEMREAIQVWSQDLKTVKEKKLWIENELQKAGLSSYFTVKSYHDYDFSKELLEQFESDKILLLLVGTIIMLVACSNIISFLVVLTQSKRKEIGMLKALGASKKQIAWLFGSCGAFLGALGCLIGTFAAYLTLSNITVVTKLLSLVLGHEAFHSAFYGETLPNHLSAEAIFFLLVLTPTLSLVAALIPAVRACRLRPSQILRSD